jgi:hypothetical protein
MGTGSRVAYAVSLDLVQPKEPYPIVAPPSSADASSGE